MLEALREDDFLEGTTIEESTLTKLNHTGGYAHFDESLAITEAATPDCSQRFWEFRYSDVVAGWEHSLLFTTFTILTFILINSTAKINHAFSNRDRFDIFIFVVFVSVPVVPSNLKDERANIEEVWDWEGKATIYFSKWQKKKTMCFCRHADGLSALNRRIY